MKIDKVNEFKKLKINEENELFSNEYKAWVKQSGLPPLTNTQHTFAEWCLKPEIAKIISQIGNIDEIFYSIKKWLKRKK